MNWVFLLLTITGKGLAANQHIEATAIHQVTDTLYEAIRNNDYQTAKTCMQQLKKAHYNFNEPYHRPGGSTFWLRLAATNGIANKDDRIVTLLLQYDASPDIALTESPQKTLRQHYQGPAFAAGYAKHVAALIVQAPFQAKM